jgi:hypothetical protein
VTLLLENVRTQCVGWVDKKKAQRLSRAFSEEEQKQKLLFMKHACDSEGNELPMGEPKAHPQ